MLAETGKSTNGRSGAASNGVAAPVLPPDIEAIAAWMRAQCMRSKVEAFELVQRANLRPDVRVDLWPATESTIENLALAIHEAAIRDSTSNPEVGAYAIRALPTGTRFALTLRSGTPAGLVHDPRPEAIASIVRSLVDATEDAREFQRSFALLFKDQRESEHEGYRLVLDTLKATYQEGAKGMLSTIERQQQLIDKLCSERDNVIAKSVENFHVWSETVASQHEKVLEAKREERTHEIQTKVLEQVLPLLLAKLLGAFQGPDAGSFGSAVAAAAAQAAAPATGAPPPPPTVTAEQAATVVGLIEAITPDELRKIAEAIGEKTRAAFVRFLQAWAGHPAVQRRA